MAEIYIYKIVNWRFYKSIVFYNASSLCLVVEFYRWSLYNNTIVKYTSEDDNRRCIVISPSRTEMWATVQLRNNESRSAISWKRPCKYLKWEEKALMGRHQSTGCNKRTFQSLPLKWSANWHRFAGNNVIMCHPENPNPINLIVFDDMHRSMSYYSQANSGSRIYFPFTCLYFNICIWR